MRARRRRSEKTSHADEPPGEPRLPLRDEQARPCGAQLVPIGMTCDVSGHR